MSSLPEAALIIASRDRPALLADTVNSVLQGETLPAEIVVVDQSRQPHPTLSKIDAAPGCQVRYIWSQTSGVSRARNIGIAAAQCDILSIIDDDLLVEPGWYPALTQALLAAGQKSVISGQVRPYAVETGGGFAPSTKTDQAPMIYQGRVGKDVLYTANMAMYRQAVQDVGGFDERLGPGSSFPGSEDSDFGYRLLEAGYRILYAPQAVVNHRPWRTGENYLPLRWNYGLGRGAFYAKYLSLQDRYMLTRMLLDIRNHLAAVPGLARRERRRAWGNILLSCGILVGAGRWRFGQRRARR
ncbi:MAG: glycosyltransferase family 2 protein [Omnitrophica WOR_2 bacterium]